MTGLEQGLSRLEYHPILQLEGVVCKQPRPVSRGLMSISIS